MRLWPAFQEYLQGLGRALMLPIAVLPVAGLLLRLGQPDLLDMPFVAAAGHAIFAHLGLLFAIGVAIGIARENHGAAGLAGAVAFVVLTEGAKVLIPVQADALQAFGLHSSGLQPGSLDAATRDALIGHWKDQQLAKLGVPAGILCGLAAGALYNRFHQIRFPEYLSFFGGRRFVPIISGVFGLGGAVLFGLGFPALEAGVDSLSAWVAQSGSFGLFLYGMLNRLLIVTGLHHILNNVAWFVIGDYRGTAGDLNRFFAGDPDAGAFMTGFFPVMMFGLPAACLAMWRAALPARRKAVSGVLLSMALTSFLTGVTEPIEFTFMFLAPALFALHAVLTGVSMAAMDMLGARIGFGFSAGLFDYILNFRLSTRPLVLIPLGLAYAALYYVAFLYGIRRFGLATPGREPLADAAGDPPRRNAANDPPCRTAADALPPGYISALGGADNLASIGACTTRLRLVLNNPAWVSEAKLKALGAKGVIRVGERGVQVVIGPDADRIASAMQALVKIEPAPSTTVTLPGDGEGGTGISPALLTLFGGADNIEDAYRTGNRWIIRVHDRSRVNPSQLDAQRNGYLFESRDGVFHILNMD